MTGEHLDLEFCASEPIHVPGSIQPYGMLLVVDEATDKILQAAGGGASLLGITGPLPGRTLGDVLGTCLTDLVQGSTAGLIAEPTYLGTASAAGAGGPLTIVGHHVQGGVVVELTPAGRSVSAAETLARMRSMTERIGNATDLLEACALAASEVRRLTGFDRVMIYKFLPDGAGSVIAEDKDARLVAFLNHRYPESDIPRQARELYRRSAIRVIADVNYTPAPLVPSKSPRTNRPLDMTYCALRSVSPVHIRYLKNMKVGASMSISLLSRGELWGLIACHNTVARLVPYESQEVCRQVGQILSQLIRARDEAEQNRLAHELAAARDAIMSALTNADDPAIALADVCSSLLRVARSDGAAVTRRGSVRMAGHGPSKSQILRLAAWLEPRMSAVGMFMTDRLSKDYPDAAAYARDASGLLATYLPGAEPVLVLWFRVEQVQEILWAGNPHEPLDPSSRLGALNPRKSFATWRETVKHRSRPWDQAEVESVQAFANRAAVFLQQQRVDELNTLLRDANERLVHLASTDALTGIANRRAFDERVREEWARARRIGKPVGLLILDLDFFKQYNDHFGHPTGDECLKRIAELLRGGRRTADFPARVGGEEFAVLLPHTDLDGALSAAESVRGRIEKLGIAHPNSPFGIMTASVGVASAQADGSGSMQDIMKSADRALYKAKSQGRNRVAAN